MKQGPKLQVTDEKKASESAFWIMHGVRRAVNLDLGVKEYFKKEYPLIDGILNRVQANAPKEERRDTILNQSYQNQRSFFDKNILDGYDDLVVTRKMMLREKIKQAYLENNITQVVYFGAGYEVASVFLQDGIKVFELDKSATRNEKIAALKLLSQTDPELVESITDSENVMTVNDHIKMIECDFLQDNLLEILNRNGFDASRSTLFIAEGLTPYLTPEGMSSLLQSTHALMTEESEFILGLLHENFTPKKELAKLQEEANEVYRFGLSAAETIPYLNQHGFAITERFTNAS